MPTTPKLALPYPVATDPADVPADMGELATRVDDVAGSANGIAQLDATGKVPLTQLPAVGGGGGGATLVTALPASPSDGQEVIYADSLTAPTYAWHLRYVAAKATNKWLFVGGAPMYAEIATQENANLPAFGDLSTVGPSITVPVAGDYDVHVGAFLDNASASANSVSFAVGAAAASGDDGGTVSFTGAGQGSTVGKNSRKAGVAAGTVLRMKYQNSAGTIYAARRTLTVVPVAVGG